MTDISLQATQIKIETPITAEDQVKELTIKLDAISKMLYIMRKENLNKNNKIFPKKDEKLNALVNHDGIPINTFYIGYTKKSKYPFVLIVNEKGEYMVGTTKFKSLSEAAEHVSGVRRSGWTFWQTLEGDLLKDLYR